MNYLPTKDVKIPGTEAVVRLCALRAGDSERVARGELDGFEALALYVWNPTTDRPVWESGDAMKTELSMGQISWLFHHLTELSKEGSPTFRDGEGQVESPPPAPDGEGVRVPTE